MPKLPISRVDLARIKYAGDPQMSPDGSQVLYTIRYANVAKNRYFTHLWLHPFTEGEARQLTVGEVSDSSARWSPDGKRLAFAFCPIHVDWSHDAAQKREASGTGICRPSNLSIKYALRC